MFWAWERVKNKQEYWAAFLRGKNGLGEGSHLNPRNHYFKKIILFISIFIHIYSLFIHLSTCGYMQRERGRERKRATRSMRSTKH